MPYASRHAWTWGWLEAGRSPKRARAACSAVRRSRSLCSSLAPFTRSSTRITRTRKLGNRREISASISIGNGSSTSSQYSHAMTLTPVAPARHLLRAKDLVDARYREPLDVPALARAARLSPAHFSREFRRTFGETPHQYLLMRRMERAAALLRNTDRPVAEICLAVGLRERRVVHDQLHADVRVSARGLPRCPSTGRRAGPDPDLRGAGLDPPAIQQVWRRQGRAARLAWSPTVPTRPEEDRC